MRLLIITQVVDKNDLYLGFFHRWIEMFAPHYERAHVICLQEGTHTLPVNVSIYSLGKEHTRSRAIYTWRLFSLAWRLRHEYDAVFVHMNQEYVLLCGPLWHILGKRIYMWRNHYAGTWLTNIAVMLSDKVFCTSQFSYTARFKKTHIMPVGIDTDFFRPMNTAARISRSILFYARMSPSKHPDIFVEALGEMQRMGIDFTASLYGTPLPKHVAYMETLKKRVRELALEGKVSFYPGVPYHKGADVFNAHEIFVNLGASGMYDKMLFEAAASGCIVLAASKDFAREIGDPRLLFTENDAHDLAEKLTALLELSSSEREEIIKKTAVLVSKNNLMSLTDRLSKIMKSSS